MPGKCLRSPSNPQIAAPEQLWYSHPREGTRTGRRLALFSFGSPSLNLFGLEIHVHVSRRSAPETVDPKTSQPSYSSDGPTAVSRLDVVTRKPVRRATWDDFFTEYRELARTQGPLT